MSVLDRAGVDFYTVDACWGAEGYRQVFDDPSTAERAALDLYAQGWDVALSGTRRIEFYRLTHATPADSAPGVPS